ncbi:glycosyltransferase [Pelagibacterales bacterium SAG-MED49]|nr:glycosyltransferase [Pelagibacterales bacterium SAG-MED49]
MKISVITSTFNSEQYLEENLRALKTQTYQNFEHIIYDNCSTDKTHKIIEKYKDHRTKLHIEQDKGIFFALNKCLKKVTGDLIFLYCSDDLLIDKELFSKVNENFFSNNDIIATSVKIVNQKSLKRSRLWKAPKKINRILLPPHTGLFIGSIYKNYYFDEKYRISSDFKYLRNIFNNKNINYIPLDINSVAQRDGGNSTKFKNQFKKAIEDIKILQEENFINIFLYPLKISYKIIQYINLTKKIK